jgi:tRNA pseudouridine38-40 synthase
MVGTLRLVGDGRWPESRVGRALEAHDRSAAGPTAPACGLALVAVGYPRDPFADAADDAPPMPSAVA